LEAASFSASQEIPLILWNPKLAAALRAVRHFAYREPDETSSHPTNPFLFFAPSA
jgi:hypothetical protein